MCGTFSHCCLQDKDRQYRWPQNVKRLQGPHSLEGDDRGGGHSYLVKSPPAAKTPPKAQTPPKKEPAPEAGKARRVYRIYKGKRVAV